MDFKTSSRTPKVIFSSRTPNRLKLAFQLCMGTVFRIRISDLNFYSDPKKIQALFPSPPPTCKFLHVNLLTTLSDCYENLHTD